jgi:hypothetical protein
MFVAVDRFWLLPGDSMNKDSAIRETRRSKGLTGQAKDAQNKDMYEDDTNLY